MNNTKKLTTGAMLLAIIGALMLIDRQLSYMFEIFIIMMMPVVIIIYSTMYDIREGAILSVCILILTFILGNPGYAFVNVPIAVIVGLGYSFGIKKNLSQKKLMIIAMLLFLIGEVVSAFIVSPLLGLSIADQISSIQTMYTEAFKQAGAAETLNVYASMGINLSNLIRVAFVLSILLVGIMEGFIIHVVALFLLNRFKIKTVDKGTVIPFSLSPLVSYICFIGFASLYVMNFINSETIKLLLIVISMICGTILFYYGYIFIVAYIKKISDRKVSALLLIIVVIFTFPLSFIITVIIGFLYGAGPLKKYLVPPQGGAQWKNLNNITLYS